MLKKKFAASVDAIWDAVSSAFAIASGMGIMKARKKSGNVAARTHFLPRHAKPPATKKQMNANIVRLRKSLRLIPTFWIQAQLKLAVPIKNHTAAQPKDHS